ncbi:MAG: glycoside hydrolase family 99-like domain-containing protein [Oscillatoriales cyanobacterium C42_A2020_001]|nr:glycoside hydrolase family 99-like domain-containing protein [Leptolyngbyaceae cyanobacterium C42_A2020_001]
MLNNQPSVRAIAFYLPQYHPIPENDVWWGKGFTEWTNVTKAKPLFSGHYQPHLPADLGFYDLRLPEARESQAELAREYGIHGFCYYHYWFNGRRILERPFNEVLTSGKPDFPFCLCWANENWTRAWDGNEKNVLLEQKYSEEDDRHHIRSLVNAFRDERYIRIDGKPLFLVYRASIIPDPLKTTSIWREEAHKLGLGEFYLCKVESNFSGERIDPEKLGFDAAIEFQPDCNHGCPKLRRNRFWRLLRRSKLADKSYEVNNIFDYAKLVENMSQKQPVEYKRFPCVTPSWDNTARRSTGAVVFRDSTPELYEQWLVQAIKKIPTSNPDERIVFINAWNEWGEGCHLEPCQKWGRDYLEATRRVLLEADSNTLSTESKFQVISLQNVKG